ncbi:MAG: Calcium-binding acidic-repeat protein (ARP) [uncultured Sulfurovum sp.]|uniref:Calcium-binding acidic-repeat protein (ARP) n=1 Tax=uncultured Sulfurovum sp. TaxID=269237 RepID=A0A6S6S2H7_9BACT|nr:MAG: Calcium-binding acidic-repeat protein (ARP) [uncultured Sulfurovum sp.]
MLQLHKLRIRLFMHSFKYLLSFFILIITPSLLFSTIYENAENKKTTKWSLINNTSAGTIKNIYDKNKKSRVIQFLGEHTKSVYILKLSNQKINKTSLLSWEMNYSEDFVIMVELNTNKGKHTLIYTPGNEDSNLQYGLGRNSTSGLWKTYERDLEKDLNNFIGNSSIITINNFVIKGSGLIDNIQLVAPKKIVENIKNKTVVKEQVVKKPAKPTTTTNLMPVINLYGKNPVLLQKGEVYVEAGASAIDSSGAELTINISHQIDIFKEGEYSVIYMTTNSMGNSVIDKRRVIVGKVSEQKEIKKKNEPDPEESLKLEQRSEELSAWETKLKAREEELLEQEVVKDKTINKVPLNDAPENYPQRPGL